jgi:hypothetical protein
MLFCCATSLNESPLSTDSPDNKCRSLVGLNVNDNSNGDPEVSLDLSAVAVSNGSYIKVSVLLK